MFALCTYKYKPETYIRSHLGSDKNSKISVVTKNPTETFLVTLMNLTNDLSRAFGWSKIYNTLKNKSLGHNLANKKITTTE